MKIPEKNHETGLRILSVLKILLEESLTKNELIEKLRDNNQISSVYTQEAFFKYFNTFKLSGLVINKDKTKYELSNALVSLELTAKEKNILADFFGNYEKLNDKIHEQNIKHIIKKLDKYLNVCLSQEIENIVKKEKLHHKESIKHNLIITLKNMLYDKQDISITYEKNNGVTDTIIAELKEITEQNNSVYIICYNSIMGRNKKINVDAIISIKQLPKKSSNMKCMNSIVFEVYDRLIYSYKLKSSEKVLNFSKNKLVISNSAEDKESLMLRLLKYGENCKIVQPKSVRDEFLNLTDSILKNLESV